MKQLRIYVCLFLATVAGNLFGQYSFDTWKYITPQPDYLGGKEFKLYGNSSGNFKTIEECEETANKLVAKGEIMVNNWIEKSHRWEINKPCRGESSSSNSSFSNSGGSSSSSNTYTKGGSSSSYSSGNYPNPSHNNGKAPNSQSTLVTQGGQGQPVQKTATSPQSASTNTNNPSPQARESTTSSPQIQDQSAKTQAIYIGLEAGPAIVDAAELYAEERKAEKMAREQNSIEGKPTNLGNYDKSKGDWVVKNQPKTTEEKGVGSEYLKEDLVINAIQAFYLGAEVMASDIWEGSTSLAWNDAIQSGSDLMGKVDDLSLIGKIATAFSGDDVQKQAETYKDISQRLAAVNPISGAIFSRTAPPIDLWTQTYSAALGEMSALIDPQKAPAEGAIAAPLLNMYGNMVGLGNLGTHVQQARLDDNKSWSELKAEHGLKEGTLRSFWNWATEDIR